MRNIQLTSDGSATLYNAEINETYHSSDGAILESMHVYISPAFGNFSDKKTLNILEIGFGTGLNALLTLLQAQKTGVKVVYETIELYPVKEDIYQNLNYAEILNCDKEVFRQLHSCIPDETVIFKNLTFLKKHIDIREFYTDTKFDVVYFDAFSSNSQPHMWTVDIFNKMNSFMNPQGILLTYSSKGIVKQALRDAKFDVKRLPGAGGKRHMLKAEKL